MSDDARRWRVALVFGGPSLERNISTGSLKPWVVEFDSDTTVDLAVYFVDRELTWWVLPRAFYYANTCEDFESQLVEYGARRVIGSPVDEFRRERFDVVVPLVHGTYGEDGQVGEVLEAAATPYLFSRPTAMRLTLDKLACYEHLNADGFSVPEFARAIHELPPCAGRVVVKPRNGGSSFGVVFAHRDSPNEVADAIATASAAGDDVFFENEIEGEEFSVIVVDSADGPVALAPTAIVPPSGSAYDTRQKFLHGAGSRLHTPGPGAYVEEIRATAARAYASLGLRHMARLDGFVTNDGVMMTDVNGIAGTGCSAFTFIQAAVAGMNHGQLLRSLVRNVCPTFPDAPPRQARGVTRVVLGGPTSERHVSRQSGFFVGLCLAAAGHEIEYVLMDRQHRFRRIGLFYALHHDVDEIEAAIASSVQRAEVERMGRYLRKELGGAADAHDYLDVGMPTSLAELFAAGSAGDGSAGSNRANAFLALHGGPGEDGTVQAALDALSVTYNGTGPAASAVSADKHAAVEVVRALNLPGVAVVPQRVVSRFDLLDHCADRPESEAYFTELLGSLADIDGVAAIVVKPRADGCSTGVFLIRTAAEFEAVVRSIVTLATEHRPTATSAPIVMPDRPPRDWVVERALIDDVPLPTGTRNRDALREWIDGKRFVEITVGVLDRGRGLEAMEPAVTVAKTEVLSLEEKFQQGGGENILLRDFVVPDDVVASIRERVVGIATGLGIEGYARVDCFWDRRNDLVYFLEANTLCGLTEATVFYAEALASFDLSPVEVLEAVVEHGRRRGRAYAR